MSDAEKKEKILRKIAKSIGIPAETPTVEQILDRLDIDFSQVEALTEEAQRKIKEEYTAVVEGLTGLLLGEFCADAEKKLEAKPVNRPLTTNANPVFSMYVHVGNSGYRFSVLRASRTDADGARQQYPVFSVSSDFFGHTDEKVLRISRENMALLGTLLIAASKAEFTEDYCEAGRLYALSVSKECGAVLASDYAGRIPGENKYTLSSCLLARLQQLGFDVDILRDAQNNKEGWKRAFKTDDACGCEDESRNCAEKGKQ